MTNRTDRLDPAVLKLAGILVFGGLAPLLDATIVNVALRTLAGDLHTSLATVQWVSSGYLLALVMAVPISGWAVERFGGRRVWLSALLLFLVGSILCANAWSIGTLIAFRVVQGIGGGLMLPTLQTLVMQAAGGRRIGRLMAVITLPALVGPILGPAVGGLIVGHLSWPWIFYLNVPICAIAMLLAWRGLDEPRRPDPTGLPRLDLPGLLLLAPALGALVYGLSQIGEQGGVARAQVLVPLAAGALLLAWFAVHALHSPRPLIDLRLLRVRSFTASTALMLVSGVALFGSLLLLPIYYEQLRGNTVLATGLLLAPQGIGSLLARPVGAVIDRIGSRPIILAGIVCNALGTVPFALADLHTGTLVLSAGLVVRGFGLSAANMAVMVGAYRDLRHDQIPHASGTTRIAQQLGGALGAAALAVILQHQLAGHPGPAGQAVAFDHTFIWMLALGALAVIPALLLPRAARHDGRGSPDRITPVRTPSRATRPVPVPDGSAADAHRRRGDARRP